MLLDVVFVKYFLFLSQIYNKGALRQNCALRVRCMLSPLLASQAFDKEVREQT